ncbi:4'-phosphopantetheinyl transferase family protein [Brevibacillus migulae]|uniref:4'-phosphopantetheinyl transferase family protein n=1 Tax=Brevibacillus migulae TaxID=1644114 RepID=UPI00106E2676|nr:4'-phosphopantetheinyl transferase superfamily protein [Brevibacillus migulae]
MSVRKAEISLFAADASLVRDGQELRQLVAGLPTAEKARLQKQKIPQDQKNSALGFTMAMTMAAQALQRSSAEIKLARLPNGRPYLQQPSGWTGDVNYAHSGVWVVGGVIADGKIGVDVEKIEPLPEDAAALFLSIEENEEYEACPPERKLSFLYEVWTLKEAFLKATGEGILAPLTEWSAVRMNEQEAIIRHAQDGQLSDWYLRLYHIAPGYIAAACATAPLPEHIAAFHTTFPQKLLQ